MILRITSLCLAALFMAAPLQASFIQKAKEALGLEKRVEAPAIRVLIASDLSDASVEVKGKYNVYDPYQRAKLATGFAPKSSQVHPLDSGIRWGELFPGVYQICLVPDLETTTTVVNGIEYRGKIYLYNIAGTISIVNEVLVEDYILSLLSASISQPLPEEVLAALAITARTDACYRALSAKNRYWHVDAKEVGYFGYGVTDFRNGIERAVHDTRYFVMSSFGRGMHAIKPFPVSWGEDPKAGLSIPRACSMAKKGADAPKIISAFFPESRIASLDHLPEKKNKRV
ncbi:MAG: hypothetical protein K0S07_337 [Chlamydiales bacterium]|jgi:hypothetical protein|nr:hypothetical protein [Chlamydiales bacterium]